jgi:hypothetical protein
MAPTGSASIDVLNRLVAILSRSLPMYLSDARPWTQSADDQAAQTLKRIVDDQRRDINRLAELILDRYGRVDTGHWPMEYTDLNLLSLDYLLRELARQQQQTIAQIEGCVALLSQDRPARELAEEILGSEKAHLEALQELVRQPVSQG